MSVSVIIPAHNEEQWVNRTINNIFDTATGEIEVIVVLNGNWHPVDPRAKVIRNKDNEGERVAMNQAAEVATGTHLLRIDAHCDFSPVGWDKMMEEVTGPTDMTQAVLTAVTKDWVRKPEHRYERCRLLPNYEAKWEKPNAIPLGSKNEKGETFVRWQSGSTIPNMSSTGCGFMIRKAFYDEIAGADESYPIMGAIGEEFSVRVWMAGGKVQTRTDVIIGHIFGTGGYDTGGVVEARRRLVEEFGARYGEIRDKFPDLDWSEDLRPTAVHSDEVRTVTVKRQDKFSGKDKEGNVEWECERRYQYVWLDDGTESGLTDPQIEAKYKDQAVFVGQTMRIRDEYGNMIDQDSGELVQTPIPPEHYEIPVSEPESLSTVDKTESKGE